MVVAIALLMLAMIVDLCLSVRFNGRDVQTGKYIYK